MSAQDHPNVYQLLDAIETALSEDSSGSGEDDLGFVEGPSGGDTTWVFLDRQNFDYGHILDEDGNAVRKPAKCMRGYVREVAHYTNVNEYGESQKLRVFMEAGDHDIAIQTGFFTNTSKSILSQLAATEDPTSNPVTIEPNVPDGRQDGNSANVLFTELYENGAEIRDNDWPQEKQDVIDQFDYVRQTLLGLEPQQEDRRHLGNQTGGRGGAQGPRQQPQQPNRQPRQRQPQQPPQQQQGRQPQQGGGQSPQQPQQPQQPAAAPGQGGGNGQPGGGDGQPAPPQQGGGGQPSPNAPSRDDTEQVPGNAPPPSV